MFKNLGKKNWGRTNFKIIATLLVITLTFANFAILGSYISESIASDVNQQNSADVNFEVYLEAGDKTKNEITADINSQEVNLYLGIDVQNGGSLDDIKIDFTNSNFELENGKREGSLKKITSGSTQPIKVPIVARKDASYNLSLLNMDSYVTLTGKYVNSSNEENTVSISKRVKINWTTSEITNDDINISQQIITNKKQKIGDDNKRIVQLLIKTNLQDNKAPVKETKIEINVPEIESNTKPEQVKVIGETQATNGKSITDYGAANSLYSVNEDKTKITINTKNDANEQGIVSWQKNAQDEYIVTYIYDEEVQVNSLVSDAKVTYSIYGKEGTIEKTNQLEIKSEDMLAYTNSNSTITFNRETPTQLYKGYMNIGQDTEYETKETVFVSYVDAVGDLKLVDNGGTGYIYNIDKDHPEKNSINKDENLKVLFTNTTINKTQALDILGNQGKIEIYDISNVSEGIVTTNSNEAWNNEWTEESGTLLKTINLSEEVEQEDYSISYEGEVSRVKIKTTKPIKEGKIEITSQKVIKVIDKTKEVKANQISTTLEAKHKISEINKKDISNAIELKEPTTAFNISLEKEDTIYNKSESSLEITASLIAFESANKLFKNPTIVVELPQDIEEVAAITKEDITVSFSENYGESGLSVKDCKITTNENGNKIVTVELEGEQEQYYTNKQIKGAKVVIALKGIKVKKFIPTKNVDLNATCINNGENVSAKRDLKIVSEGDFLYKNIVKIESDTKEYLNQNKITINVDENKTANITTKIINNYSEDINNIQITGTLSGGRTGDVTTNIEEAVITYDGNTFTIKLEKLEKGKELEIVYNANTKLDQFALLKVQGKVGTVDIKKEMEFIISEQPNADKLNVDVKAYYNGSEITDETTVKEGQMIEYDVVVKNISQGELKNVSIVATKENGTFYKLIKGVNEFAGMDTYYYDEDETESVNVSESTLNANNELKLSYRIIANENTAGKDLINNITVKANGLQEIKITRKNKIASGNLKVIMQYGQTENVELESNSVGKFIIYVKNISGTTLENVELKIKLPKELTYNEEQSQIENLVNNDGELTITISKLESGEEYKRSLYLNTGSITGAEKDISLMFTAKVGEEEYKSNTYTRKIIQNLAIITARLDANVDQNVILKNEDEVVYTLTIKNEGIIDADVNIEDMLPKGLQIVSVKRIKNEQETDLADKVIDNKSISAQEKLKPGEEIQLQIRAKYLEELIYKQNIDIAENSISITGTNFDDITTNKITYKLERLVNESMEDPEEETKPAREIPDLDEEEEDNNKEENLDFELEDDSGDGSGDGQKPEQAKPSISGLAWIDENKNGIRDNNEEVLQGVRARLFDIDGEEVKDENGNTLATLTSLTGTYKFNNVEKGEYIIVFEFDSTKYTTTKYQVEDAEENTNSDAIVQEIEIDEEAKKVGIAGVLKVEDKNIENIDIGLILNQRFDLQLNKYISKVSVTTNSGTTIYDFQDTNLAKIEIGARQMQGAIVVIEYELQIQNEGEIDAYVEDVLDYASDELAFSSGTNEDWYEDSSGILHNISLSNDPISPGDTKTVKLILTKTLTSSSTGTVGNIAEIGKSSNMQGIQEYDSEAGDMEQGQDDISEADLIISIRTGHVSMYIGIVIISLSMLSIGLYFIYKKVIIVKEVE